MILAQKATVAISLFCALVLLSSCSSYERKYVDFHGAAVEEAELNYALTGEWNSRAFSGLVAEYDRAYACAHIAGSLHDVNMREAIRLWLAGLSYWDGEATDGLLDCAYRAISCYLMPLLYGDPEEYFDRQYMNAIKDLQAPEVPELRRMIQRVLEAERTPEYVTDDDNSREALSEWLAHRSHVMKYYAEFLAKYDPSESPRWNAKSKTTMNLAVANGYNQNSGSSDSSSTSDGTSRGKASDSASEQGGRISEEESTAVVILRALAEELRKKAAEEADSNKKADLVRQADEKETAAAKLEGRRPTSTNGSPEILWGGAAEGDSASTGGPSPTFDKLKWSGWDLFRFENPCPDGDTALNLHIQVKYAWAEPKESGGTIKSLLIIRTQGSILRGDASCNAQLPKELSNYYPGSSKQTEGISVFLSGVASGLPGVVSEYVLELTIPKEKRPLPDQIHMSARFQHYSKSIDRDRDEIAKGAPPRVEWNWRGKKWECSWAGWKDYESKRALK